MPAKLNPPHVLLLHDHLSIAMTPWLGRLAKQGLLCGYLLPRVPHASASSMATCLPLDARESHGIPCKPAWGDCVGSSKRTVAGGRWRTR
jgi:hypothetical protein